MPSDRASGGPVQAVPNSARSKCDLWVGEGPEWVIEVKMARLYGDNGKPDDTAVAQVLSPYPSDHSALSDCMKLIEASFTARTAVMIYGFESEQRPIERLIDSFELLASAAVLLGDRHTASFGPLVHPVHRHGTVWLWEVRPPDSERQA